MDNVKKVAEETRKKKTDPLLELEGNQKLNKLNKLQFKKEKRDRVRRGMHLIRKFSLKRKNLFLTQTSYSNFIEKAATKLADQLGEFNISASDDYDFNTDFVEK